jgi:hypothetical protein
VSVTVIGGAAVFAANPLAVNVTVEFVDAGLGARFDNVSVLATTLKASGRTIVDVPVTCTVLGPRVAPGEMVNVATKFWP